MLLCLSGHCKTVCWFLTLGLCSEILTYLIVVNIKDLIVVIKRLLAVAKWLIILPEILFSVQKISSLIR